MAKNINKVTDNISLAMREMIDATENEMILEVGLQLHKGSNSEDTKKYLKTQVSNKKNLDKVLKKTAIKNQELMFNVADNIAAYTGTNSDQIKKEINRGMKMVVRSAKSFQNQAIKKISRLDKFRSSANYVPDIKKSIVEQTKKGIDQGLPITYKNGRKVSYKAYMEMAVRTGIQQEIGNTQLEVGANANIVFYVANEFADCADDHRDYQGKVYYDERYRDFNLIDEIKDRIGAYIRSKQLLSIQSVRDGEPFFTTRPNCRHTITPIAIDEVLDGKVEDFKDQKNLKEGSYRKEEYELTKQQRYNERQIRKYKSRVEYYKNLYEKTKDETYLREMQNQKRFLRAWQKRQKSFIEDHPQLFRDYDRESPKRLMPDLGISKIKLKIDPNKPPTPIDQNPPTSISPTFEEHYNTPKEDPKYLQNSEENIIKKWENATWQQQPPKLYSNEQRKYETIYYKYKDFVEKEEEKYESDDVRKKVLYLYKNLDVALDQNAYIKKLSSSGQCYSPFFGSVIVDDLEKKSNGRAVLVHTHEYGHAIEKNLVKKTIGSSISGIRTSLRPENIHDLSELVDYDPYSKKYLFSYKPIMQFDNAEILDENQMKDRGITQDQIDLMKSSYSFSKAIIEDLGIGGNVTPKRYKNFVVKIKDKAPKLLKISKEHKDKENQIKNEISQKLELDALREKQNEYLQSPEFKELEKKKQNIDNLYWSGKTSFQEYKKVNAEVKSKTEELEKQSPYRQELIEKINQYKVESDEAINRFYEEEDYQTSQVDDLLDALSGGVFLNNHTVRSGHGKKYYDKVRKVGGLGSSYKKQVGFSGRNAEVFTHLLTLNVHNPKLYAIIKEELPEITTPFENMLDLMVKE